MTPIDTFTDILRARSSCRAFRPDPVDDAIITRIVDAARHVPSWCNAQPWQLTITKGAATDRFRDALALEIAKGTPPAPDLDWPASYSGVYGDRRRSCGFQLYDAVGIEKSDHAGRMAQMMRNYALFDAPHVAIVTSPAELGAYGAMDSGGYRCLCAHRATAFRPAARPPDPLRDFLWLCG